MLRHLKHTEINRQKWDECINASSNCRVYAMSWYLDVVCKKWEAIVEDDYIAVMPLPANKKYGINYLFQPHFTQQLGIFSKENIEKSIIENFLNAIPEKFRFVEICLNSENSENISTEKFAGFYLKKNSNFELKLNKSYTKVSKYYSENTKRNIKKALKNKITFSSENIESADIIRLFRKNKGREFSHLKTEYYQTLKSIIETCEKKNLVNILRAFDKENKLCAGAVFIIYKNRAIFLFSATNYKAKKNGAMFLLIDTFITNYCETLTLLDFEGSNNADIARFYKSFGAKECVYLQLKKNNLPKYIQWLKK